MMAVYTLIVFWRCSIISILMQAGQGLQPMKAMKRTRPQYYDDRFEHIEYIGYGSYGEVYKVRHR